MADSFGRFGGLFGRGDPAPPASNAASMVGALPAPEDLGQTSIRLSFLDPSLEARRRVLLFMLGAASSDLGRLVDVAGRGLDPRRDLAVFVVSTLEFAPLRDRGVLFEYLPAADDLGAREPEAYLAYVRRRLSIIRLKWDAAAEIEVAKPIETWLSDNVGLAGGSSPT
ncbi:MAG TPA: hypothetical protein VMP03_15765 [Methylomirabilota bacterium]|nr:hypothetical protein [Methylomirabilota bacterium]